MQAAHNVAVSGRRFLLLYDTPSVPTTFEKVLQESIHEIKTLFCHDGAFGGTCVIRSGSDCQWGDDRDRGRNALMSGCGV
jgi:hypothetical protein